MGSDTLPVEKLFGETRPSHMMRTNMNNARIWKWSTVLIVAGCSLLPMAGKAIGYGEAAKLNFSLRDNLGRQLSSQDYVGVPVFLEFGACW